MVDNLLYVKLPRKSKHYKNYLVVEALQESRRRVPGRLAFTQAAPQLPEVQRYNQRVRVAPTFEGAGCGL